MWIFRSKWPYAIKDNTCFVSENTCSPFIIWLRLETILVTLCLFSLSASVLIPLRELFTANTSAWKAHKHEQNTSAKNTIVQLLHPASRAIFCNQNPFSPRNWSKKMACHSLWQWRLWGNKISKQTSILRTQTGRPKSFYNVTEPFEVA